MPTPNIKTHSFLGNRYEIELVSDGRKLRGAFGDCDDPLTHKKKIRIYDKLTGKQALVIDIHEATHACMWWLDESIVEKFAEDLGSYLYRRGYRIVEEE